MGSTELVKAFVVPAMAAFHAEGLFTGALAAANLGPEHDGAAILGDFSQLALGVLIASVDLLTTLALDPMGIHAFSVSIVPFNVLISGSSLLPRLYRAGRVVTDTHVTSALDSSRGICITSQHLRGCHLGRFDSTWPTTVESSRRISESRQ